IIRRLRDLVLSLLMTDKELFPNFPDINEKETYDICISIKFDEEFRREQFLDGIDIPQNYSFKIKIDELTTKQRMLLWDLYYDSYHELPKRLEGLSLPTYDEKNKKINLGGKSWAARINPYVSERKEIMNAWQTDYENAYQEVISLGEVNNDE
ncbi:MAG: hypothetical protein SVR94_16170, partial [Pseudomonadota bacterium]|nr:hypothetical protein [Pseudomonadota bacterium]